MSRRIHIMRGIIQEFFGNGIHGPTVGYIMGENEIKYYFTQSHISEGKYLSEFSLYEQVEFDATAPSGGGLCPVAKNVHHISEQSDSSIITPSSIIETDNNDEDIEQPPEQTQTDEDTENSELSNIGFFKHGRSEHLRFDLLKEKSGEKEVIDKLRRILYVSYIGTHDLGNNSVYQFCILGNTKELKQFVRGRYEFLLVFSHFDKGNWQQKTLRVASSIRQRKEIAERRLLANFYILISNAANVKAEIERIKGGTSAAVIPFTFDEILACSDKKQLQDLLLSRFEEFYFENNMLGEKSAIEEDMLLFGDRGKIADSIVQRCKEGAHSGVFGLRRSGKSSVLRAVIRRLKYNEIKYIDIQSRSDLEHIGSWKLALFDIARRVRIATSSITKQDGETREQFDKRLGLFSTEEDYEKRPTQCFVDDYKRYAKEGEPFVIAIDEIELITYNSATSKIWQDLDAFSGFWGALRDSGCSLVLCGVNSTINERSLIEYKGKTCDNPMYERIHLCADFSKTYLPAFTDEQTKTMINTLGGYSNVAFNNVYSVINRAFGGQPYAIRQFCAFMFDKMKGARKPNEVYEFSMPTFDALVDEFCRSTKGSELFSTILQHVTIYKGEYEMLKHLAFSIESDRIIDEERAREIDHLEKYGIIEYDKKTRYVTFNITRIREYIQSIATKDPIDMNNDERRHYVQDAVAKCEKKLKQYILNYYRYSGGEPAGRTALRNCISANPRANPAPDIATCDFKDFFDHQQFIMYFSAIKKVIVNNWGTLGRGIKDKCNLTKEEFQVYMSHMNAGRSDADHYDAEEMTCPEDWEIDNATMTDFIEAHKKISLIIEAFSL